ncbi:type II secretion system F family protein [Actinophytocola oryzae]|uniref:Flp pilus assembly protein TadB n=1 Tax=Actinophytocola oryzae TaxID=502181 RepID=A0A4R7V422_9PSEU|nr:pilus assembly protein TadB [Actinophytocola oryzae]TDV44168.1 Flp pilus assembly protein TadB [Actinophytocola oryzae]
MTTTTSVFVAVGAGVGIGLWLVITGWRTATHRRPRPTWWRPSEPLVIRGTIAAGAGVAGGVLTGWVASVPLIAAGVWSLPRLLGRDTAHATRVARIEAIATWTEMLRDTLAAAGLEQAILASAPIAPTAISHEVTALANRLEGGEALAPSLRYLADDLADPTADLVVSSLLLAATQQARQLGELLGSLAITARNQAAMRMRVEASRSRTRTTVRIVVGTTLAFAAVLTVLNREYLAAYDTAIGQLVLLATGTLFACAFAWLVRIAALTEPGRVLARVDNKDISL